MVKQGLKAREKNEILLEIGELKKKKEKVSEKLYFKKNDVLYAKRIKNLTLCGGILKLVAPFCLVTIATVMGGKIAGGGYPFYLDEDIKYKYYSVSEDEISGIETEEKYILHNISNMNKEKSTIIVCSPWNRVGDEYEQIIRSYEVFNLEDVNLYYALINDDVDYILNNYDTYNEELILKNSIDVSDNNYVINADVHIMDRNDLLYVKEDWKKNIVTTMMEVCLIGTVSVIMLCKTKKAICRNIKKTKEKYLCELNGLNTCENELSRINNKLLILNKRLDKYDK